MLEPHIFGSSLVICFIILRISKQSFRFCSSATLFRNSVTLASFTLVLTSAFAMSASNDWIYRELHLPWGSARVTSIICSVDQFLMYWHPLPVVDLPGFLSNGLSW